MASMQEIDEQEIIEYIDGLISPDRYTPGVALEILEFIIEEAQERIAALKENGRVVQYTFSPP